MTKKETIALKLIGFALAMIYAWTFAWTILLNWYGGIYYPLKKLGLRDPVFFELFVCLLTSIAIGLVFWKFKEGTFKKLVFQDILIIVLSMPLFNVLLAHFDDTRWNPSRAPITFILTVLTMNLNDWYKTKKPATNSA